MTLNQSKLLFNLILSKHKGKKVSDVYDWWHYKDIEPVYNYTFDNLTFDDFFVDLKSIQNVDFISIARFRFNACIPTAKGVTNDLKIYSMDDAVQFFQIDLQDII